MLAALDRRRAAAAPVLRGHRRGPGRVRVGLLPPAAAPARGRGERRRSRRGRAVLRALPREAAAAARARRTTATVPPVLLVDEVDRADDEFEAFLLEILSDWSISVPELGVVRAEVPPIAVLTSNRTRDVHDALKRRCLYHWIAHPDFERELAILRLRAPEVPDVLARDVAAAVEALRDLELYKPPGVAETIDWAQALATLGTDALDEHLGRRHARHDPQVPRRPGTRARARRRRPRARRGGAQCLTSRVTPWTRIGSRSRSRACCAASVLDVPVGATMVFARGARLRRARPARPRLLGRPGDAREAPRRHRHLRPRVRRRSGSGIARRRPTSDRSRVARDRARVRRCRSPTGDDANRSRTSRRAGAVGAVEPGRGAAPRRLRRVHAGGVRGGPQAHGRPASRRGAEAVAPAPPDRSAAAATPTCAAPCAARCGPAANPSTRRFVATGAAAPAHRAAARRERLDGAVRARVRALPARGGRRPDAGRGVRARHPPDPDHA